MTKRQQERKIKTASGGVEIRYQIVDGAHFFTSPDIPGLCAAHKDLRKAAAAIGYQLEALLPRTSA